MRPFPSLQMIREEDGSDKAQDKGQARLNRGTDFAVEF